VPCRRNGHVRWGWRLSPASTGQYFQILRLQPNAVQSACSSTMNPVSLSGCNHFCENDHFHLNVHMCANQTQFIPFTNTYAYLYTCALSLSRTHIPTYIYLYVHVHLCIQCIYTSMHMKGMHAHVYPFCAVPVIVRAIHGHAVFNKSLHALEVTFMCCREKGDCRLTAWQHKHSATYFTI